MDVNDFIKLRQNDWQRLQTLLNKRTRLSVEEIQDLGYLYRAVASDLAIARRDYPNQRVGTFLNQLVVQAHQVVYQQTNNDPVQVGHVIRTLIPQTFRQTARFTLVAFLLFFIPAIIGYFMMLNDPFMAEPLGLEAQRAQLANNDLWTEIPIEERPYASGFIMGNNIRVSILAFGGGVFFGLFSIYLLVTNGLHIGGVLGLAVHYGLGRDLLSFILGHGFVELSVIFISGGAGLQLGWALLNPGPYSRRDALVLAARRTFLLVLLAIPLLVVAGLIEGFISPTALSLEIKLMVGLVSAALMYAYLLLSGRRPVKLIL